MKALRSGVYQILNNVNGKCYVGSAVYYASRKATHLSNLRAGTHPNAKLQNAWNKHGEEAFSFSMIVACMPADLLMYEQRCIDALDAVEGGYNILPNAGSALGFKHSDEHRAALAGNQHAKGMKHSDETKARISNSLRGNKFSAGVKKSDSARAAVSVALKGRKQSPEHVAKRIAATMAAKAARNG